MRGDDGNPSVTATFLHYFSHQSHLADANLRPQYPEMDGQLKPAYNAFFNNLLPGADRMDVTANTNFDIEAWISSGQELFTEENLFQLSCAMRSIVISNYHTSGKTENKQCCYA